MASSWSCEIIFDYIFVLFCFRWIEFVLLVASELKDAP